jgi:tetratricopeptide (TPR) repeat protein
MQQAREGKPDSRHAQADYAYRRALDIAPGNPGALVGMAWVCNSRHEFDAGRLWAERAIALDAGVPEAHALLGDAALECGDYDQAFKHYQTGLDLRPDLASYARAAHLLWMTGDANRAKRLMQRAIKSGGPHAENTAWCRAELARMMFESGALMLAEKQLDLAARAAPDNAHVLAGMGRLRAAKGDLAGAIERYEHALRIGPARIPNLAALFDLYELTGDRGKADETLERMLELRQAEAAQHAGSHGGNPAGPHTHGNMEFARFLADHDRQLDRALAEAQAAYAVSRNVRVIDTLAWCYHKNGRRKEAARTIREALRWGTPEADLPYHAGMILIGSGEILEGRQYLYRALNLNPHFDPVQAPIAVRTLAQSVPGSAPEGPPSTPQETARQTLQ